MTIEEAFALINNLELKESHRRYGPQHGLLVFDREGQVVSVSRYKETPHEKEQCESLSKHPGCVQIFTWPGLFGSTEALKQKIEESMWLFAHMKPSEEQTSRKPWWKFW